MLVSVECCTFAREKLTLGGAPVLELCKVLAERGFVVEFATNAGQEEWAKYCPLIQTVNPFGPGPSDEKTETHYRRMLPWSPADGLSSIMKSKYLWDSYWTVTYLHLKRLVSAFATRPDFIIADFFADAAVKDMMVEFGVPIAIVWPQMPFLMAPVSYIPGQPGFQIDMSLTSEHASIVSRIRNEMVLLWALPSLLRWTKWTKDMRTKTGVRHESPSDSKPDYLVLVNSFFGLEAPKDIPPSIVPCGPILGDSYPELDDEHASFLDQHKRVLKSWKALTWPKSSKVSYKQSINNISMVSSGRLGLLLAKSILLLGVSLVQASVHTHLVNYLITQIRISCSLCLHLSALSWHIRIPSYF
jgi:hypothetical protein